MTPHYMASNVRRLGRIRDMAQAAPLVEVVSVEDDRLLGILAAEELLNIADVGTHLVCFRDLKRLQETVARVGVTAPINLLCVFRGPKGAPVAPQPAFTFLGYDLTDDKIP